MKKNKMMRLASALMVMTLLTTSIISGTFAKYVTEASGSDSARVAKFGVVLSVADDSTFQTEYATDDEETFAGVTVKSSDEDKLVAPGTTGSVDFSITGKPEVAVKVDVDFTYTEDVFLKSGDEYYFPVVFTLSQENNTLATGNLNAIKTFLDGYTGAKYAPNTELDAAFTLSWEWDFDDNGAGTYDALDTELGDLAAGLNPNEKVDGTDYNLDIDYSVKVTVTQID